MSNVGPSPTISPDTSPITSHTSTQQWQSFEFRMRHRRAERCLLRAEIALEAGLDDDAREALDEAERLHSENPKLAELRGVLGDRVAASVAAYESLEEASTRGRLVRLTAAAIVFLLVGTGAYFLTRTNAPDRRPAPSAVANTPAAPANSGSPLPAAAPAAASATGTQSPTPAATSGQIDTPPSIVDATLRVPATAPADGKPALPAFNPQFSDPRPVTLPPPSSSLDTALLRSAAPPAAPEPAHVVPDTPAAAPTITLDRMGERLPPPNLPPSERGATLEKSAVAQNAAPDSAPLPNSASVNEEPRVRAALARYEAAYSGLDASAAQAVWPAVDERSLARAFDSLHSQQVALGRCAVQVEGSTASASCSGQITWTPKVGGGSQTAARQWRFELHSGNGTWQITRAEVR